MNEDQETQRLYAALQERARQLQTMLDERVEALNKVAALTKQVEKLKTPVVRCCKTCKHFRPRFFDADPSLGDCGFDVYIETPKLPESMKWAQEEIEEALSIDEFKERMLETEGDECACYEEHPCFKS